MRALAIAFLLALAVSPLTAFAAESHVWINNTTDKFVWVTAFSRQCKDNSETSATGRNTAGCTDRNIVHEWCTAPGQLSKQGFHVHLNVVHILVTAHPNCGRPIITEWVKDFIPRGQRTVPNIVQKQYNIIMHTNGSAKSYEVTTP